jgi:uncharacterized protein (TIGR02466 family)
MTENDNDNEIIFPLFPTPIYISKLNRELNKEELLFIDKTKLDVCQNDGGNTYSNDNYVLNQKVFNSLKEDLYLRVQYYFKKILSYTDSAMPFITQSWLNYTETNQHHHRHQHYNSILSGVFYINCDEKFDKIKFFNNNYQTIKPEIKEYNIWNSDSWNFPVKTGDIVLFPSSLMHMVETKKGTNTRISLAFNTFLKGDLGLKDKLSQLIL